MNFKRRNFLNLLAIGGVAAAGNSLVSCKTASENTDWEAGLIDQTKDIKPIDAAERANRIAKAQQLMAAYGIEAILLDAGTSMVYFTGIYWWPSERSMLAIIPKTGSLSFICPAFEEDRMREMTGKETKIYPWQEDESPYIKVTEALNSSDINSGKIGLEEQVRFFIFDGIRKIAPQFNLVAADPVTITCRLIKSPAEIALMQRAFDITQKAILIAISQLKAGMDAREASSIVKEAHELMGAEHDFALVLFGKASALPHGTRKPQLLKKGDVVLMDCGCKVGGYSSDITRTVIYGAPPTERQQEIWDLEQKSQLAGFEAAQLGVACEMVDFASRKVITDAGFGPEYQLPGLPHRTGHGIGMDGHEWGNMVKGNKLLLEPGMCFSIEPTIAIPGEFGIRMEDCVYMTESGPKWFNTPAISIDKPFA